MGHPLNVYSYHVRYGHSVKEENDYQIHESVCFSTLFSNGCKSKYYRIIILKGEADLNKYYSNFCFFTKKEIKNHLKQIPNFCDIKFKIKDITYKGDEAFQLDLFIDSSKRIVHKYVLTWVRSLFEWPFYLYLIHAKKLKQLPQFRFESVINLFNLVATVHRASFHTDIHTFGTNLLPSKKKEIINTVNHVSLVNHVFNRKRIENIPQCELVQDFDQITDKLYEENLPKYLEAYKMIENESNNNRE